MDTATTPEGAPTRATLVSPHGDPVVEDRALHEGAALFDRGDRGRMSLAGAKAAELLAGLVTNDVLALPAGGGQYAAILTPKGKIVADVRIFARSDAAVAGAATPGAVDRLLVDTGPRAADALASTIRKYVNPRIARYVDERASLAVLGVFGPRARAAVSEATGLAPEALAALPAYGHLDAGVGDARVMVARVPELLVEGYDLFLLASQADALLTRLAEAGVVAAGAATWEVARVEAGRPEWGLDMDEGTIPQEANFDELGAISYTKGCYTGQETVARVHFRGHVNRHLRHVRVADDVTPPRGAELVDETGKVVGDVRSAVRSPRAGALAIAMVRREVAPGARVVVRWDGGEAAATVTLLPYVPAAG